MNPLNPREQYKKEDCAKQQKNSISIEAFIVLGKQQQKKKSGLRIFLASELFIERDGIVDSSDFFSILQYWKSYFLYIPEILFVKEPILTF